MLGVCPELIRGKQFQMPCWDRQIKHLQDSHDPLLYVSRQEITLLRFPYYVFYENHIAVMKVYCVILDGEWVDYRNIVLKSWKQLAVPRLVYSSCILISHRLWRYFGCYFGSLKVFCYLGRFERKIDDRCNWRWKFMCISENTVMDFVYAFCFLSRKLFQVFFHFPYWHVSVEEDAVYVQ